MTLYNQNDIFLIYATYTYIEKRGKAMAKKSITPDYTKKAIQRYNDKFDRIAVNLPKGTKDKIKELTGLSCNKYISSLVLEDLQRMEDGKTE